MPLSADDASQYWSAYRYAKVGWKSMPPLQLQNGLQALPRMNLRLGAFSSDRPQYLQTMVQRKSDQQQARRPYHLRALLPRLQASSVSLAPMRLSKLAETSIGKSRPI